MTDLEAVRGILAGRRELFAVLVDRHKNLVFTVIRSYLEDRSEVEDLAQEVFIKAYRSLARYRGDASFSTWLYRIALNHLKDHLRRRRPETAILEAVGAGLVAAGEGSDPEREVEAMESRLLLEQALAELPETYRRVIYLYHYRGLSYAEIGECLKLSKRGVETRLYRATMMLRDRLARGRCR